MKLSAYPLLILFVFPLLLAKVAFCQTGSGPNTIGSTGNVVIGSNTLPNSLTVTGPIFTSQVQASSIAINYTDEYSVDGLTEPNYGLVWSMDNWSVAGPVSLFSAYGGQKFITGGKVRMAINWAGNVGIGTVNPQSLLAMEGTITAQVLNITQTGWSDFVFDSTYQRMPLYQLAAYVHKYKHLPGIPSAGQIAASGLDIGAMQKLHMQKIEELTLDAIEAEAHAKAQDSTIAQQRQMVNQQQQIIGQQQQTLNRQQALLEQLQAQIQKQQGALDKLKASVTIH